MRPPGEGAGGPLARLEGGERVDGMDPEDLLRLPHRRFFRIRGLAEAGDYILPGAGVSGVRHVYLPSAGSGNLLTENRTPIAPARAIRSLPTVPPQAYSAFPHFRSM